MQHFDLYNRYSILITISHLLKLLFREPRFHPSSSSSPFPSRSRLKTLESPIEPPAHLAFFAFEVPDPDVFDTVICFNSASSSSELITISSQAFSCSYDRIHSLCFCNLFVWLGKLFTLDSRFKQKELCRHRLTFFAKSSSSIDSLALVLFLQPLSTLFHPVVIAFRWVSRGLLKISGPISARNCRYSFRYFFM